MNNYNNYNQQIDDNQDALAYAYQAYSQQAAMQNQLYQNQAYHQQYNKMHQDVNPNQSMIDLLRKIGAPRMVGCLYVTCAEEITWALLQDYEQSLTQPDLYIKWEK